MHSVEANSERNILFLTLSGLVTVDEVRSCQIDIEAALSRLRPGFRILTDMSDLEAMDLECAPEIRVYMDRCRELGVSHVVRVIPDPSKDIGFSIMSIFHFGRKVTIQACETRTEALKALGFHPEPDQPGKTDKL